MRPRRCRRLQSHRRCSRSPLARCCWPFLKCCAAVASHERPRRALRVSTGTELPPYLRLLVSRGGGCCCFHKLLSAPPAGAAQEPDFREAGPVRQLRCAPSPALSQLRRMRLLVSSEGGAENSLNAPVAAEGESAAQPSRGTSNSRVLCSGCRVFPAHSVPADSAVASFHRPFGVA